MSQKPWGRVLGARTAFVAVSGAPVLVSVLGYSLWADGVDWFGWSVLLSLVLGLTVGTLLCARSDDAAGVGVVRGTLGALLVWIGVGLFGLAVMSSIGT